MTRDLVSSEEVRRKKRMTIVEGLELALYVCMIVGGTVSLIIEFKKFSAIQRDKAAKRGARRIKAVGRAAIKRDDAFYGLPSNGETMRYAFEDKNHGGKCVVRRVEKFLGPEECKLAIREVGDKWSKSEVMNLNCKDKGSQSKVDEAVRTSSTYLTQDKGIFAKIKKRAAAYLNVDADRIENLQVVRYLAGQKFEPHVDYFDVPNRPGVRKHGNEPFKPVYSEEMVHEIVAQGGQRVCTMFVYLNDSDGVTRFPRLGASYEPKEGDALLFSSFDRKGRLNPNTTHEGCAPTEQGSPKYGLNIWVREYSPKSQLSKIM